MSTNSKSTIPNGVMLNAYPDSIGKNLADIVNMLKKSDFKDVFSLFYVLPTFFNSDLDRGFSIIDYNLNKELVSKDDLKELDKLNIMLKFDIVLNHLSVASPQFKDLLQNGEQSKYKDFFINWNNFWKTNEEKTENGVSIPKKEFLDKLFMRKSGLPILKVPFPDGTEKPYWNTFYQKTTYNTIDIDDLKNIVDLDSKQKETIVDTVNKAIVNQEDVAKIDFKENEAYRAAILTAVNKKRSYLGQMDVNAKSELVWDFYDDTLRKLKDFGCKIVRLDAFAYLHKEIGETNFFNKPGTWQYLERLKKIAQKYDLALLPEIHSEYGTGLHKEVSQEGYYIYDFFFPGLIIHAIETGRTDVLIDWIDETLKKGYKTVNMLGCHDGIPVLDLKGKTVNNTYHKGLLEDKEIEAVLEKIMARGGRVKNLYGPSGKKISYYQVNATFFSALGESEQKLLFARAIQMFMPGIPQVWYLDIFAGTNDYEAADRAGNGGHKEINRTTLTLRDIEEGLKKSIVINQLEIMRLRNTSKAFLGYIKVNTISEHELEIAWTNNNSYAKLLADFSKLTFTIDYNNDKGEAKQLNF